MTPNEYQALCRRTADDTLPQQYGLQEVCLGLCGEAGEAASVVRKNLYQGKKWDQEHFIEELGDTLWYLARAADIVGVPLEEVMQKNIDKLAKRYPARLMALGEDIAKRLNEQMDCDD